jgi:hypothetical protein
MLPGPSERYEPVLETEMDEDLNPILSRRRIVFSSQGHLISHKLALLKLFNRGRQPASWKWCPPHQAGLDLFAHLAYPVEFTYHPLPVIPFPAN